MVFSPQCELVASLFSHLYEEGRVVVFAVICRVRKVKCLAAGRVVGENEKTSFQGRTLDCKSWDLLCLLTLISLSISKCLVPPHVLRY